MHNSGISSNTQNIFTFSLFFTLRDIADTVESFRRRQAGGMSPIVVVSGVAVATLMVCLFLLWVIEVAYGKVPLRPYNG